jgi:glutamyl-tRNA reductase
VLERMTVGEAALPKLLTALLDGGNLSEVVVVSTCARTEVYAVIERFHAGLADIYRCLGDTGGATPEELADGVYCYYEDAAVSHLFEVAAGLDSAVLGEGEVLSQVRRAWELARHERSAGPVMSQLFRHAVEVGKRARSETAIARGITSISQAAVALVTKRLGGSLAGRRALVLGAGDMGEGMAVALGATPAEILVANRTWERAEALAERVGGRAVSLEELPATLADVDVLLASTRAEEILLGVAELAPVMAGRDGRSLLVVDVAVPRNVDPSVGALAGLTLLDMDDLRAFAEAGMADRRREVARVADIIAEEVARHLEARAARDVAPTVSALRERAEAIRASELSRYRSRLAGLSPSQAATVEALTRQLMGKWLHEPSVALKEAAGSPRGERLGEALRTLFDL